MAISFTKNKEQLVAAWKDILNDTTDTNWALFSYEKQSFELQLSCSGDGGLEELQDELNSGKIMYAISRVSDPKTGLPKFILINWQGEGAPLIQKGSCANHVQDVVKFFKGLHITVNARTEEDVEPQMVMDQVAKSATSSFNFKDRSEPLDNAAPVGSVYQRVRANSEINPSEREKFWLKEQEEEKVRQEDERKQTLEARKKLEEEIRDRELKESQARDKMVRERNLSINKLKEAEKNAENSSRTEDEKQRWEKQLADDAKEQNERRDRAQSVKRQRSQEAQDLIAQRTTDAKAVFEQNTCAGQMSHVQRTLSNSSASRDYFKAGPDLIEEEEKMKSFTNGVNGAASQSSPLSDEDFSPEAEVKEVEVEEEVVQPEPSIEENGSGEPAKTLKAKALYDYQAADDTEISFDPDDIITNIDQIDEGWWQGMSPDGTFGLFPANYVELIN